MKTYYRSNNVPPIIAFGKYEQQKLPVIAGEFSYNYESQISILPLFMGSDQKVTKSAQYDSKNSTLFHPRYKNVGDDAKEK